MLKYLEIIEENRKFIFAKSALLLLLVLVQLFTSVLFNAVIGVDFENIKIGVAYFVRRSHIIVSSALGLGGK